MEHQSEVEVHRLQPGTVVYFDDILRIMGLVCYFQRPDIANACIQLSFFLDLNGGKIPVAYVDEDGNMQLVDDEVKQAALAEWVKRQNHVQSNDENMETIETTDISNLEVD